MERNNLKMKIVIFTHYLKSGGAEKRASIYASYFASKGDEVTVVTNFPIENEYEISKKVKRIYLFKNLSEYKSNSIRTRIRLLRDIYEKINPSFVISFLPTYSLYSALAVKGSKTLLNTQTIYSVTVYRKSYSPVLAAVDFLGRLYSSKICIQCNEQLKYNKLFKKKCFLSYNPVVLDKEEIEIKKFDSLKLLSMGRLTKQKNHKELIKYVVHAKKFINDISLDIYGTGTLKNKLEKLIEKFNASSYIKIKDFSMKTDEILKEHNVYILSSKYEGFPNSLVEAMSKGLICLSKPCPTGPREIISHEENGFLYKTKDDFINILASIKGDNEKCYKIALNAKRSVLNKFDQNLVLESYKKSILNK